MPAGRPRSVSLPPDEMVKLAHEMIKWVEENRPMHLSQWYCIEKGYTDDEWDTMRVCPEFFHYYKKALKMIGMQYLAKDSPIDPSLKHRWQRIYFKDLKDMEDDDLRFKSSLTKDENRAFASLSQIKEAIESNEPLQK
jgi:hypothetical protein